MVWFASSVDDATNNTILFMSIWAAGAQVAASEVRAQMAAANHSIPFCCIATVTVSPGQAIEGRWRVNGGTGTIHQRTLMILKVG
jgi:translation initiation factor 2 gamma subunit (eIF-2gamma)